MLKKRTTFYVGTDPDPTLAVKAVAGLRAMVRLGKEAEKTLRDLKNQGYSNRRTCWLKKCHGHYLLIDNIFPEAITLTRSDIPGYDLIEVCLTPGECNSEFQVMVTAHVFDGKTWEKKTFSIGKFKVTKRRGVFRPIFPYFRNGSTWNTNGIIIVKNESLKHKDRIAHVLSEHIAGEKLTEDPYSAELARQIQIWLIEDGFIDKLIQYLWQFSKDQILVKRIMMG